MKGKDQKPHIVILGRCNSGKSSLLNSILGQELAIVSDLAGTTTDPVKKSVEILGIGSVIMIDTAGIDDLSSKIGEQRIEKSEEMIYSADMALIVISNNTFGKPEQQIIDKLEKINTPFIIVYNKVDTNPISDALLLTISKYPFATISAKQNRGIDNLIELIKKELPEKSYKHGSITKQLVSPGDIVLLITPIDSEAPEGRLILPQVQMIRDLLDNSCIAVVSKLEDAPLFLSKLSPKLVITDSQVFKEVDRIVDSAIPLTSFSMLLAHSKGSFEIYKEGIRKVDQLKDGDKVLILESCSHTVSCEDIGRNKIPQMLRRYSGKELTFDIIAGLNPLPKDIETYALVIQCGGCVITPQQIKNRINRVVEAGVAVTNYGMIISYMTGTYQRTIACFER